MSPVAMCGIPYASEMRFACVPLPEPWGPKSRMFTLSGLLQETLVRAHHHLRLHLPHRVERDADDDDHGRPSERAGRRAREVEVVDEDAGHDGDEGEVDRPRQREP